MRLDQDGPAPAVEQPPKDHFQRIMAAMNLSAKQRRAVGAPNRVPAGFRGALGSRASLLQNLSAKQRRAVGAPDAAPGVQGFFWVQCIMAAMTVSAEQQCVVGHLANSSVSNLRDPRQAGVAALLLLWRQQDDDRHGKYT